MEQDDDFLCPGEEQKEERCVFMVMGKKKKNPDLSQASGVNTRTAGKSFAIMIIKPLKR